MAKSEDKSRVKTDVVLSLSSSGPVSTFDLVEDSAQEEDDSGFESALKRETDPYPVQQVTEKAQSPEGAAAFRDLLSGEFEDDELELNPSHARPSTDKELVLTLQESPDEDLLQTIDDLDYEEKLEREIEAAGSEDKFRTISNLNRRIVSYIEPEREPLSFGESETGLAHLPDPISAKAPTDEVSPRPQSESVEVDVEEKLVFASARSGHHSEPEIFETGEYVRPANTNQESFSDDVAAVGGLFGEFRLLGKIASGGMAEIFLAVREKSDQLEPFVLKKVKQHRMNDLDSLRLFREEGKICLSLSHPNIIRYESFDIVNGVPYLAMELVDGMDLNSLFDLAILSPRSVVEISLGVSRALLYAHTLTNEEGKALKVVHRDVSPQNILIGRNGDVKLADFGIARFEGRSFETGLGPKRGKLSYMAPEQLTYDRPLDFRADLFALGCVMAKLLTGQNMIPHGPVVAGDVTPKIRRILGELPEGLPPRLIDLVVCLMTYEVEKRPWSTREVVTELEFLSSELKGQTSLATYAQKYIAGSLPSSEVVIRNLLQGLQETGTDASVGDDDVFPEETAYPNTGLVLMMASTGDLELPNYKRPDDRKKPPVVLAAKVSSLTGSAPSLDNAAQSDSMSVETDKSRPLPASSARKFQDAQVSWIGFLSLLALISIILFLLLGQ